MKRLLASTLAGLLLSPAAFAIPIGGIEFPDGTVSFADAIVSFSPGFGVGVGPPIPTAPPDSPCSGVPQTFNQPSAALGVPNYTGCTGAVSLGDAGEEGPGELIVQFTDNSLTTSGDSTADLHIFEIGVNVEAFFVDISVDGIEWIVLGLVSGQPTSIDIDAIAGVVLGELYSFVRLRDDPSTTALTAEWFRGPDIDAIGAISSGDPVIIDPPPVPEPATLALLGLGLLGIAAARRRRKGGAPTR